MSRAMLPIMLSSNYRHVVTGIIQRGDGKLLVVQRSDKVCYVRLHVHEWHYCNTCWSIMLITRIIDYVHIYIHIIHNTCISTPQVGSYQLKWGGVSGYLEPDDTSLAYRACMEATEEVGLPHDSLQFIRAGRPLLVDQGPHRQFAVHPVLLQLTAPSSPLISLNWENIDYTWVDQEDLHTLPHVPQLPETAARVLPDAQVQAALQWLERDRAHGAAELALFVLDAMQGERVGFWVVSACLYICVYLHTYRGNKS